MLSFPGEIRNEQELDAVLTQPGPELTAYIRTVVSPLLVFGAGGKMGPTLAVMAKRAAEAAGHPLEVIAISRFSDAATRLWIEQNGVRTITCDLLDREAVRKLPDTNNLINLVGYKFGTSANPSATWAMNTLVPANIAERYNKARIVALSTGNVYPMSEITRGGAPETSPLTPLGEYANAAVARERLFEFFSLRHNTPLCLLRLFYAVELRYGIISELARAVAAGDPIEIATGAFNCIWQRDANEMILRSLTLASSPPAVFNLCQPEIFSVRNVAAELGERLGVAPLFHGAEATTALLGDARKIRQALGQPPTPMDKILDWTAQWVQGGGRDFHKPTRFAVRDGAY
jgi:nucleoside-diphosphate-sugar epimerase